MLFRLRAFFSATPIVIFSAKSGQKIQIAKSKSILLLIHLNGFISNPNPYFWILSTIHLIGYGLDID